jgi:hypothetical protein
MKLLTATTQTQGQRASDFNWCVEGELVTTVILICARDEQEGPDGGCGCGRAFSGLNSHRSGTTAVVRDVPITTEDLTLAVRGYRENAGWFSLADADTVDSWITEEVEELIESAAIYPVGVVLENRSGQIGVREVCAS